LTTKCVTSPKNVLKETKESSSLLTSAIDSVSTGLSRTLVNQSSSSDDSSLHSAYLTSVSNDQPVKIGEKKSTPDSTIVPDIKTTPTQTISSLKNSDNTKQQFAKNYKPKTARQDDTDFALKSAYLTPTVIIEKVSSPPSLSPTQVGSAGMSLLTLPIFYLVIYIFTWISAH